MRILEVVPYLSTASIAVGQNEIIYQTAAGLAGRGHQVSVYTSDEQLHHDLIRHLEGRGVTVRPFRVVLKAAAFFLTPGMILSGGQIRSFDLIHLHGYRSFQNLVVAHYAHKYGIPYLFQAEGSLCTYFQKGTLKRIFDHLWGYRMIGGAAGVITASTREATDFLTLGVDPDRIRTIPFGIDGAVFGHLPPVGTFRSAHGIPEGRIVILFLGRVHRIKGLDLLLGAFAELVRDQGLQATLVIAGPDDGYLATVTGLVESLGVGDHVLIPGPLFGKQKLAAYGDADLYVLPSFHDDFGLTAVEAMACGTPVVVTDRCGVADLVRKGAGLVVPYDQAALRDALSDLVRDSAKREEMGRGAAVQAATCTWDQITASLESVYAARALGGMYGKSDGR